jgi:aminoglycoside phosphotransferase family enzyme
MDPHNQLIHALTERAVYGHPTTAITVLQTHISWVVLTGPYAYKSKKPVKLGFVDFSTLDKRHFFCQEELRLNRRLAPRLCQN